MGIFNYLFYIVICFINISLHDVNQYKCKIFNTYSNTMYWNQVISIFQTPNIPLICTGQFCNILLHSLLQLCDNYSL